MIVDGTARDVLFVTFTVPEESIHQGNAVIAVRDKSNAILWSWHIWVTDYVPLQKPTVEMTYDGIQIETDKLTYDKDNVGRIVMGAPLGWCEGIHIHYDERSATANFVQTASDLSQSVEITQQGHHDQVYGNCTYYQFGRKDPAPGGDAAVSPSASKKTYSPLSDLEFKSAKGPTTISNAIATPNVFWESQTKDSQWCIGTDIAHPANYINLWANKNEEKTIYDPSPPFYKVAPEETFTGFTCTGERVQGNYNLINSCYTDYWTQGASYGWVFYCKKMPAEGEYDPSGGITFYRLTGCREDTNGSVYQLGQAYAYYWTSKYCYVFYIYTLWIYPCQSTGPAWGRAVRAVREN